MKITLPLLGWSLLAAPLLSIIVWCWLVLHTFEVPEPLTTLPSWLLHTFSIPELRFIGLESLAFGVGPVLLMLYLIDELSSDDGVRIVHGTRVVSAAELTKRTRLPVDRHAAAPRQITLAGVPLPLPAETTHTLLAGATGKGKTMAQNEILAGAHARGDRTIIVDPDGEALSRFWRAGDTVLCPFDRRSPGWSLFNEVRGQYDYERVACSVVSDCADPQGKEFRGYGRTLLCEVMRMMAQTGETSTERLIYWATQAPAPELGALLAGTPAAGQFLPSAERALASTRYVLSQQLAPLRHIKEGPFALRDWVANGTGNVYLPWREDMLPALGPLLGIWTDLLISAALTVPTDDPPPLWMMLDELGALGNLPSLDAALTRGRKHGLRIVACLQALSQLVTHYGPSQADTLLSNFLSVAALGGGALGEDTAQRIARGFGRQQIERRQKSHTKGKDGGVTTTTTVQRDPEREVVSATDLIHLPPLRGYLKLDGDYPVARIRLTPRDYPIVAAPFEER